jgi:predicted nuclease of predicted toxin-antitoxin system
MNHLFIELYLDEDVDVLVAELLKARGFMAITTQKAKQKGRKDSEQLAFATSQQMALLTHNRVDFELLARQYFEAGKTHYGIIIATRRPAYELVRRLLVILNHVTAEEMMNQIRYI